MAEPLSPSALAVLRAAGDSEPGIYATIAAALRAAADQISYENELGLTAFGGHAQAQDQILAIAAELKGHQ